MLPKKLFTPKCLHPDRDIVFRDDLINFYEYILDQLENLNKENQSEVNLINNLTYKTFKSFWRNKNMSMLHFSKTKEENSKEYYEVLFGEIQQFFLQKNQFRQDNQYLFQLMSIYSLYSLYYTQINPYLYQINTIPEILRDINTLLDKLIELNIKQEIVKSLCLIVKRLYQDEAFSIGAIIGLKTIMLNKYGLPLEQKTNVYRDYLDIKSSYSEMMKQEGIVDPTNQSDMDCSLDYNRFKKLAVDMIKKITANDSFGSQLYCDVINNQISNVVDMNSLRLEQDDFDQGKVTNLDVQFFQTENNMFNK